MALPDLAPFKIPGRDQHIDESTWTDYLHAWVICTQLYLAAPEDLFVAQIQKSQSLPKFLRSFVREHGQNGGALPSNPLNEELRKTCFLLVHRIWFSSHIPSDLKSFYFLSDFSLFYGAIARSGETVDHVWESAALEGSSDFQQSKEHLIRLLDNKALGAKILRGLLHRHGAIARLCSGYGNFLMTGSDLLDSMCSAYRRGRPETQRALGSPLYFALYGLCRSPGQNVSLLLDHLFALRSDHQGSKEPDSLLHELITATPLLYKIRRLAASEEMGRLTSMLQTLEAIGSPPPIMRKRPKRDKGKRVALEMVDDTGLHKESQISQIQELFPDLGSAFITRLLDEYANDVETVTAHLLEDSLPPHLQGADRAAALEPPTTLPPSPRARRNVFDNDQLDNLAVSAGQLHIGRRDDASAVLSQAADKSAIFSALAAFDPDDDERDDTYDAEDVGGTVDVATSGDHADDAHGSEELLFHVWKASPEAFARDPATRRSPARGQLREQAGLTDEALEGWALMLARDPARVRRLELKFEAFSGNQRRLESTRWRAADAEEGEEGGAGRGRGGFQGRAMGRGRGGRGRDVAGAASDKGTQVARQRKDANKGSRANHNRRDGRAKKLARAGFAG